jgi:hypothetical protein
MGIIIHPNGGDSFCTFMLEHIQKETKCKKKILDYGQTPNLWLEGLSCNSKNDAKVDLDWQFSSSKIRLSTKWLKAQQYEGIILKNLNQTLVIN